MLGWVTAVGLRPFLCFAIGAGTNIDWRVEKRGAGNLAEVASRAAIQAENFKSQARSFDVAETRGGEEEVPTVPSYSKIYVNPDWTST